MTRRYTGAEARELAAKATQGEWTATDDYYEWCVVGPRGMVIADTASDTDAGRANAALIAAAPDLAASLAAAEAERDALRAAVREYLRMYDMGCTFDDCDPALAALREAAK